MSACAFAHKHCLLWMVLAYFSLGPQIWSLFIMTGNFALWYHITDMTCMYHNSNGVYYAYVRTRFSWKTTVLFFCHVTLFSMWFPCWAAPNRSKFQKQTSSGLQYQDFCTTLEDSWICTRHSILISKDLDVFTEHGLQFQVAKLYLTSCACS